MPTDRKSAATRFWFHLDKYGVAPGESFELMLSTAPNERVAHIVGNLIDTCASICLHVVATCSCGHQVGGVD